jgi:hypothetical protein
MVISRASERKEKRRFPENFEGGGVDETMKRLRTIV